MANYDSVATAEGGQGIVDTAINAFGRVDILINNAGILRDKTIIKMEPENWDAVMDVHLKGAYNVTRPAFVKMRGKRLRPDRHDHVRGRFVRQLRPDQLLGGQAGAGRFHEHPEDRGGRNTTSRSTPLRAVAATRLTEDILPPELFEKLKPEFVAPLVLYLCSEQCPVTGGIYNAGMGYFNRAAMLTGAGVLVGEVGEVPSPEDVAAAMGRIKSLDGARELPNVTAVIGQMMEALSPQKAPAAAVAAASPKSVFEALPGKFNVECGSRRGRNL